MGVGRVGWGYGGWDGGREDGMGVASVGWG